MGTWLITGCSGGLGEGIARAALEHGENVAVTARNPEKVQELVRHYSDHGIALRLDLNDRDSMKKAVDPARGGRVIVETALSGKLPSRLLLGSEAAKAAEAVMENRLEEIRQWMEVSRQADFQ